MTVSVRVVRNVEADARSVAEACERALRGSPWDPSMDSGQYRVCGLDTMAPQFELQDGSGRYVYKFDVILTVTREI